MLLANNSSFSKKLSQSGSNISPHIAITDTKDEERTLLLCNLYHGENTISAIHNTIKPVFFHKEIYVAKRVITLGLWDKTLGQLLDDQALYKNYAAIILLHDMTKSSANLKYLIKGLRDTYKQAHIVLAGTKYEDTKNHLVSPQELQELAQEYNCFCFFINLQEQTQINSLFEHICKIILGISIDENIEKNPSSILDNEKTIQNKGCFFF